MSAIQQMLLGGGGSALPGQVVFTAGNNLNTTWTVPAYVTSICALAIGPGTIQGGGCLRYVNNIAVTPGETLNVISQVNPGAISLGFSNSTRLERSGVVLVSASTYSNRTVTTWNVGSGGNGGASGSGPTPGYGGAGGYSGNGGAGGSTGNGSAGSGGGGGGGGSSGGSGIRLAGGGGVGLLGQGANGSGGAGDIIGLGGKGGSGGGNGQDGSPSSGPAGGGLFGGGGDVGTDSLANNGALRIIWGAGRSFPSNAGDV